MSKILTEHRHEIDALDDSILELLERRATLAKAIGIEKKTQGLSYFAIERESAILNRLQEKSTLLKPHITSIYREIMGACLACQRPPTISFLGPLGTYSHMAALKFFGHSAHLTPIPSIAETLREVEKGSVDFAVVPFENSVAGAVGEVMDLLVNTPLLVSGEVVLRIRHNLFVQQEHQAIPLKDISLIYGHPQALYQCRHWLQANTPHANLIPTNSNVSAVDHLSQQSEVAALIGSTLVSDLYHLFNRASDIEDFTDNTTRFFVLSKQAPSPSGEDKTSFVMSVHHQPGSMYRALKIFADQNVNMTKLESRPFQAGEWKFIFFIDVIGHQQQNPIKSALASIREQVPFLKILGSYPLATD